MRHSCQGSCMPCKVDPQKAGGTNCAQTCIQTRKAACCLLQPALTSQSLMGNMCSTSRLCGTVRGSSTLSLFSNRGNQTTDGGVQRNEMSACFYHAPHTPSVEACRRVSKSFWQPTASKLLAVNCAPYGPKCLVCGGILPGWGGGPSLAIPSGVWASSLGGGGGGGRLQQRLPLLLTPQLQLQPQLENSVS